MWQLTGAKLNIKWFKHPLCSIAAQEISCGFWSYFNLCFYSPRISRLFDLDGAEARTVPLLLFFSSDWRLSGQAVAICFCCSLIVESCRSMVYLDLQAYLITEHNQNIEALIHTCQRSLFLKDFEGVNHYAEYIMKRTD